MTPNGDLRSSNASGHSPPFNATQNDLCGGEPPPFDLTILGSIQKYEFRTIDHSSSAISGTVAI
jgi:hypothetical protein